MYEYEKSIASIFCALVFLPFKIAFVLLRKAGRAVYKRFTTSNCNKQ